jgi:hypothetical protein
MTSSVIIITFDCEALLIFRFAGMMPFDPPGQNIFGGGGQEN